MKLLKGTVAGGLVFFVWNAFISTTFGHPASLPVAFAGNLLTAFLATLLLLQLGPRALVEKVLFLVTVGTLSWAGVFLADAPPPGQWGGLFLVLKDYLIVWTLAGTLLAWLTRPAAE